MRPAEREHLRRSCVDHCERHDRAAGIAVTEDDVAGRPGRRVKPRVVRPPLLEVVRTAYYVEDDLRRGVAEDLALDGPELHVILLQPLVATDVSSRLQAAQLMVAYAFGLG